MTGSLFGGQGHDRDFQTSTDRFCNLSNRHTLFCDCVIPRPSGSFFKRQPIEGRCVEPMHCGPAVETGADIGRDSLLASERNHVGGQALLVSVVNLWDAHDQRTHAACSQ